jgi:hypothetical protein
VVLLKDPDSIIENQGNPENHFNLGIILCVKSIFINLHFIYVLPTAVARRHCTSLLHTVINIWSPVFITDLSIMATWFQCKIQYAKFLENDKVKMVSETYLVDAVSFTDAEARLYRSLGSTVPDFLIQSVSKTGFKEIFNYEDCETWYKCKVAYHDIDESNGKEKRFTSLMLVSAQNCRQAIERIDEQLKSWIIPYDITDVNLSPIIEVIPYVSEEEEMINSGRLNRVQAPEIDDTFAEEEEIVEEFEIEEELSDDESADEEQPGEASATS